jgi:hypothetical protein
MAPDPAVVVSSSGGDSGASRRCLAPPEIGTRLSIGLDCLMNLGSRAHLLGASDGGPLSSNAWDAPDQGVGGEGDPDSV